MRDPLIAVTFSNTKIGDERTHLVIIILAPTPKGGGVGYGYMVVRTRLQRRKGRKVARSHFLILAHCPGGKRTRPAPNLGKSC